MVAFGLLVSSRSRTARSPLPCLWATEVDGHVSPRPPFQGSRARRRRPSCAL